MSYERVSINKLCTNCHSERSEESLFCFSPFQPSSLTLQPFSLMACWHNTPKTDTAVGITGLVDVATRRADAVVTTTPAQNLVIA